MNNARAILLYRATCAKCRVISLALVWLSLGAVRRVPLSSPVARELCDEHRLQRGKFALITDQRTFEGWHAVSRLLVLPLALPPKRWLRRLGDRRD